VGSAQRGPGRKCWPAAAKLSSGGQTAEVGLGVGGVAEGAVAGATGVKGRTQCPDD